MDTDTTTAPRFDPDDLAAAIIRSTRARLCITCALDGPGDAAMAANGGCVLLADEADCDNRHNH